MVAVNFPHQALELLIRQLHAVSPKSITQLVSLQAVVVIDVHDAEAASEAAYAVLSSTVHDVANQSYHGLLPGLLPLVMVWRMLLVTARRLLLVMAWGLLVTLWWLLLVLLIGLLLHCLPTFGFQQLEQRSSGLVQLSTTPCICSDLLHAFDQFS